MVHLLISALKARVKGVDWNASLTQEQWVCYMCLLHILSALVSQLKPDSVPYSSPPFILISPKGPFKYALTINHSK